MAGREGGSFTMRRMGRLMLHLGLVVLLLGVFLSENVVINQTDTYFEGTSAELGPSGITVGVSEVNLVYWVDDHNFELQVVVLITEGNSAWLGLIVVKGDPEWQSRTQDVYVQTTAFRDVFVSLRTFGQVSPTEYNVELQARILPLVSFVWLGAFLMVMALLPLAAMEFSDFRKAVKEKDKDLYDPEEEPSDEELPLSGENE